MARLKINILQERSVDQINLKHNGWYNKGITSTVVQYWLLKQWESLLYIETFRVEEGKL